MKKLILSLALFMPLPIAAQPGYVYPNGTNSSVRYSLPENRQVVGATKIVPIYAGNNIPDAMKNAFQKACHIWEERIPTTFPIYIQVSVAPLADTQALAHVAQVSCDFDNTMDKVFMKRYYMVSPYPVFDGGSGGPDMSFFTDESPDAFITFTNKKTKFNFSLDNSNEQFTGYDFVTVAIQAIGKAIGFQLMATYNSNTDVLTPSDDRNNFTSNILWSSQTYASMSNRINIGNNYSLYYPSTYDSKSSLSFFAKNLADRETAAMQPGVPAQAVVHYIGDGMDEWFDAFGWNMEYVPTGEDSHIEINGTGTSQRVPYMGNSLHSANHQEQMMRLEHDEDFDSVTYINELKEYNAGGYYVMMSDGTWEHVTGFSSVNVSGNDSYARSVDGDIRMKYVDYRGPGNITVNYILYSYIPQNPEFRYSSARQLDMNSTINVSPRRTNTLSQNRANDYYEVEISFTRVEGCSQILVEQTDSDYPVPYTYYVDPTVGSFVTYMNRNYSSTFRLWYINANGQTVSDYKTINLNNQLAGNNLELSTRINNSTLHYDIMDLNGDLAGEDVRYTILSLNDTMLCEEKYGQPTSGDIDISSLPRGCYVLNVCTNGKECSAKFKKQ